jgi:hypothetical protein
MLTTKDSQEVGIEDTFCGTGETQGWLLRTNKFCAVQLVIHAGYRLSSGVAFPVQLNAEMGQPQCIYAVYCWVEIMSSL